MRRWLLVFLLALLPLQLSWAAVAAYCQHGQVSDRGAHFGHHEHQQAEADADGHQHQAAKKGLYAPDCDCATCHLGHAVTLPGEPATAPPPMGPPRVAAQHALPASHIPPLPERPDRRLA